MARRSRRSPSTDVVDTEPEQNAQDDAPAEQLDLFAEEEIILRQQIPSFILGNRTTRPAIITTATTLVKDARKKSGHKAFTKHEIRALPHVIRGYFEERSPDSSAKSIHAQGGRKWSIHAIVQNVLAEEVRVQKEHLIDEYKRSPQYKEDKAKGQVVWAISFQAAAVQDVIASLSSEEIARYTELAAQWTLTNPPIETQRENAEKKFVKTMESVSRKVFTQMGARVFMLGAYTDTSGNLITVPLDFSEVVGETSFYKEYQDTIENSEVYASFEKFVKSQFKAQQRGDPAVKAVTTEHIRPGVRALMSLQKTPYGEPIMLAPHHPPTDMVHKKFLTDLLRSTITTLYALARGTPTQRVAVPWKMIKNNPRKFVSEEYLTPKLLSHWGDPSHINLDDLKAITYELYNRQRRLRKDNTDSPFFWFHAWYDKANETFVQGSPRTLQAVVTHPDRPDPSPSPKKSVTWGPENGGGEENREGGASAPSSEHKQRAQQTAVQAGRTTKARSASPAKKRKVTTKDPQAPSSLPRGQSVNTLSRSPSRPFPAKRTPSASQSNPNQRAQSSSPQRQNSGPPPATTGQKLAPQIFPQRKISQPQHTTMRVPYPVAPLSTAYRSPIRPSATGDEQRGRSVGPRRIASTPTAPTPAERAPVGQGTQTYSRDRSQSSVREEPVARRTRSRSREPDQYHEDDRKFRREVSKGKQRAVEDLEDDGDAMDVDDGYPMDDDGFQDYNAEQWDEAEEGQGDSDGEQRDDDGYDDDEFADVTVQYEDMQVDGDDGFDGGEDDEDDEERDSITAFTEEGEYDEEEDYIEDFHFQEHSTPVRQERRPLYSPTQSRALKVPRSAMASSSRSSAAGSSRMPQAGAGARRKGKGTSSQTRR